MNATITIRDFTPVAPSFSDDTGDAISGTVGTAITPVTVPAADGDPAPTYAASGLPAGLAFNTTTRVLSGTPTAAGSGTITVTATNSEGAADWTAAYSFVSATPTDQTVTAEGRHDTRGEAAVSEEPRPRWCSRTPTIPGSTLTARRCWSRAMTPRPATSSTRMRTAAAPTNRSTGNWGSATTIR